MKAENGSKRQRKKGKRGRGESTGNKTKRKRKKGNKGEGTGNKRKRKTRGTAMKGKEEHKRKENK